MKNKIALILLVFLSWNCQSKKEETMKTNNSPTFYVGTYTDGESQGIYSYKLQENGHLEKIGLAAKSTNPSFLATSPDKKFLLAVNEVNYKGQGTIESFLITEDSLSFLSRSNSGGADPCFVSINNEGYILVANYNGGNVGLLKLKKDGTLTPSLDIQQHTGKGITERQEKPHAHSAWFSPIDNSIISADLGTDQLWFSNLDTIQQKLKLSNPPTLAMEPGAGPRHLAFHPNKKWAYVINELNSTVVLLEKSKTGAYTKSFSISTLPEDFKETNTTADIRISSDGKFLYASNRGHNSIAIYAINDNGTLKSLGYESVKGNWPRSFSLSPDENYLVVANQYTNSLVSFKRDKSTGLLTYVDKIEAPAPVYVLFK